jgi:hypothetical protein
MKSVRGLTVVGLWAICMMGPAAVMAGWPPDPAVNLAVVDRTGEQTVPKVASTSDGGCYIGWYDHASGNYDVCLQRLDPYGSEVWPHNGILVSSHPQDTWVCDWDLMVDSADNAVLTFVDLRTGGDWDVYAYRISSDGAFLWGADGVAVTDDDDFDADPRIAQTSDGSFVVVWSGDGGVGVRKLSADGAPQFGLDIAGEPNENPTNGKVVAADDGSFVVSWMRDNSYPGPNDIRAQKYSGDGTALWPTWVAVFDDSWIPPWYEPILQPDYAGGAIVAWHRSNGVLYSSFVQHLASDGSELFPHNGVEVSTLGNRHHIDPTVSYNATTGEIFVFWNERNPGQTLWGVYAQKISASGQRTWSDSGVELMPVNDIYKFGARSALQGDGAMVFWLDEPTGSAVQDRVAGLRVDTDGALVWPDTPTVFCSLLSSKGTLPPVAVGPQGMGVLVWWDERNSTRDLYAQNVNPDGTLGLPGDLDGDGCIDQVDLGILLSDWGCTGGNCPGDCDGDGNTGHSDLGILLAHWGQGCPP